MSGPELCGSPKKAANWFMGEVLRLTKDKALDVEKVSFTPEHLADLIQMVEKKEVSAQNAKKVFEKVFEEDIDPVSYIEEHGLKIVEDTGLLNDTLQKILDENPGPLEELLGGKEKVFGFFVGKIIDSAIIGLICFAGTTILGFESAAFISVVIGVTNIIPFFGPFIGAIPCALLLLLGTHPWDSLYFLIFIVILQQIDGNIIGPKILGNTTGVSSFWVLFSILLFGGLWGIVGMVIAVPLFGVIYDIIRKLVNRGLRRNQQEEMRTEYDRDFHKPQEKKQLKPRKEIKDIKLLKNITNKKI